jgi:hypothetical protein
MNVVCRHEFIDGINVFIVPNFFENATRHSVGIGHVVWPPRRPTFYAYGSWIV